MSQYVNGNYKSFPAAAAIGKHLRVKLNGSGKLAVAGATDFDIGTLRDPATFADEPVAVRLVSANGTVTVVAAGAIAENAVVYGAAAGKVNDVQATDSFQFGIALEAATADGDVIEVLRTGNGDTPGS